MLLFTACQSKPTCHVAKQYSATAADRIAKVLDCDNKAAIALDVQDTVEKTGICTEPKESGLISLIVCKPVTQYVGSAIVRGAVPKDWQCRGGIVKAGVQTVLYRACTAIPF